MRLLTLAAAALATLTTASPVVVSPVNSTDSATVTSDNTLNATTHGVLASTTSSNPLTLEIVNNYAGTDTINAYISGHDTDGNVVLLNTAGSFYYPSTSSSTPEAFTANIALPLNAYGETTTITIPDSIISGRIWLAVGDLTFYVLNNGANALVEPSFANSADASAGIKWGFLEFNYASDSIYANLSFVDFVGLILGMSLTLSTGAVQTVKGLLAGSVQSICDEMQEQAASDGMPWDEMCVTDDSGNALRILSTNIYQSVNSAGMSDYFTDYIDQVWTKYTNEDLVVNTQGSAGNVTCRVSASDSLACDGGDNRGYTRPTSADIYGCNSGPFAIDYTVDNDIHKAVVARLCAAFNRGTLLLDGGNYQPSLGSDSYYTTSPNNHYSRIVHEHEDGGLGYAFSYDDVNPAGENAAGTVSGADPTLMRITVGGWTS